MAERKREIRPGEPGYEEQRERWRKEWERRERRMEAIRMIVRIVVSATASVLTVLYLHSIGWV